MIRVSHRLARALRRPTWRDSYTLGPWRRQDRKGDRHPQECPSGIAYERRWSDGSLAGRVWLNGDAIEVRHRWYSPKTAYPFAEGGNYNGVRPRWEMGRPYRGSWTPAEAIRECARQRPEIDRALATWLARPRGAE